MRGCDVEACANLALSIKIAQQPYIIGSLGPKALTYESFEGNGYRSLTLTLTPPFFTAEEDFLKLEDLRRSSHVIKSLKKTYRM